MRPETGSLTAEAFARLRDEILSCRLMPGQKLVIAELCAALGFSLGAVREALSRLTSEGLVVAEPRKGFRVAPITAEELQDITRTRATIESLCLESAIRNGDLKWETAIVAAEFELSRLPLQEGGRVSEAWAAAHKRYHEALVAACDSPWLLRLRDQLFTHSDRYRRVSVPLDREKRDLVAEHRALAQAVLARDIPRATEALRDHLEKTTRILVAGLG